MQVASFMLYHKSRNLCGINIVRFRVDTPLLNNADFICAIGTQIFVLPR